MIVFTRLVVGTSLAQRQDSSGDSMARPSQTMPSVNAERKSWTIDMGPDEGPVQPFSFPVDPRRSIPDEKSGQPFSNENTRRSIPNEKSAQPRLLNDNTRRSIPDENSGQQPFSNDNTRRSIPDVKPGQQPFSNDNTRRSIPEDDLPRLPFQRSSRSGSAKDGGCQRGLISAELPGNCPFKVSIEQIFDDDPDYFRNAPSAFSSVPNPNPNPNYNPQPPAIAPTCPACPPNYNPQPPATAPNCPTCPLSYNPQPPVTTRVCTACPPCPPAKERGEPNPNLSGLSQQELRDLRHSISGLISSPNQSRRSSDRDDYRDRDTSENNRSKSKAKPAAKSKLGTKSKIAKTKSKTASSTRRKSPQKRKTRKNGEERDSPEWTPGSQPNSRTSFSNSQDPKRNSRSASLRDQYDEGKPNLRSAELKITVDMMGPPGGNCGSLNPATGEQGQRQSQGQDLVNEALAAARNGIRTPSFSTEQHSNTFSVSQGALAGNIRSLEENLAQITKEYSDLKEEFETQKAIMATVKAERDKNGRAVDELSRIIASNEAAQHSLLTVIQDMKVKMESLERRGLLTPYSSDKPLPRTFGSNDQEGLFTDGEQRTSMSDPTGDRTCVPKDGTYADGEQRSWSRDEGTTRATLKDNCATYSFALEGTIPYEPDPVSKGPGQVTADSRTPVRKTKVAGTKAATNRKPAPVTKGDSKGKKPRKK